MNRSSSKQHSRATATTRTRQPIGIGCIIVLAVVLTHANSLNVPFLFDDNSAIARNATIRNLWSLDTLTAPLHATGATGRPLVNLSLAINYAIGRNEVWSYHLFNLLLHAASALLLFSLIRRTLSTPAAPLEDKAIEIASITALLWAVHPLQTESVTCIIQRTELLGGFFLLLTLFCFVRATEKNPPPVNANPQPAKNRRENHSNENVDHSPRRWAVATVVSCFLGMAAKEFVVVAPALVLLYDRTFVAGTFRNAWTQRWKIYCGLGASWLVLAVVLSQAPQRNHNVGFGLGVSPWDYLLTQCKAIVLYLKLTLWPYPLVLDYGTGLVRSFAEVWWQGGLLLILFAATLWALVRRSGLGFLGACFFAVLAPSSSFVPLVTQTIAEHRMYLPLAPVLLAGTLALGAFTERHARKLGYGLIAGCAVLTWQRNQAYSTAVSIWSDTAKKVPENYRAHYNLGNALIAAGRPTEAAISYESAARLRPDLGSIQHNLAVTLSQLGRGPEAIAHYANAVRLEPKATDVRVNFAATLAQAGRLDEAIVQYQHAAELEPKAADIHASLAYAFMLQNHLVESMREYEIALQLDPANPAIRDAINELRVRKLN